MADVQQNDPPVEEASAIALDGTDANPYTEPERYEKESNAAIDSVLAQGRRLRRRGILRP